MKYIDEYRDGDIAKALTRKINDISRKPVRFMEICGTHTMAIFRHGIRSLLPETIDLVSGPGCPVCVTAIEEIDRSVKLARHPDIIITTFGDMLRVPGTEASLQEEKSKGAGHGGLDFIEDYRLVECIKQGKPTDMNVYDAAAWSAVTSLSEKSIARKSGSVDFPDFTRGKWKTTPRLEIMGV